MSLFSAPPTARYPVTVLSVNDGDSFTGRIGLPFGVSFQTRVRLSDIDAPDTASDDAEIKLKAIRARDRVRALVAGATPGAVIEIETNERRDKWGRILARLWIGGVCVNDLLVTENLAVPYDGGKRATYAGEE